jgi:nucleotide-binding universal stress UspA family protein
MTDARMVGDVVVAIDFSDRTDALVAEGAALARASGGVLHLVHVAAGEPVLAGYDKDDISAHTRSERAGELTDEHRRLREMGAEAAAAGVEVKPLVVMGPTAQTILETTEHLGASHLVIGSHGHGGLHHLLVGSVAEEVVRHATVAVVLIPIRSGR